jgi:proteasome accessory factor C
MLTLVPWLLERPGATIAETANAFGVTERTIRTDLSHLDFCGLPGLGGGDLFEVDVVGDRIVVRMADELRRPLRPTPREALRLVLTVEAAAEAMGDELPALRSAITKIRAALGIPERIADVVPPASPGAAPSLREAISLERRVVLAYQGRGDDEPQRREIEPWALHLVDGVWYLQGFDLTAQDRRTFRLDRIATVDLLDEPRTVRVPDELPAPRYTPGPDDLEVVLDLAPGARWIRDAVAVDAIEERDGTARVRLRTDTPGWIVRLVSMAGGDATVVEPASLGAAVSERARSALARYGPG